MQAPTVLLGSFSIGLRFLQCVWVRPTDHSTVVAPEKETGVQVLGLEEIRRFHETLRCAVQSC